jgi:hypothetical protein
MTKTELLADLGQEYFCDTKALNLAKQAISASEAARRSEILSNRIDGVMKAFNFGGYTSAAAVGACWLASALKDHTPNSVGEVVVCALTVSFFTFLAMIPVFIARACVLEFWANSDTKYLLEPIAGTSQCVQAVRHLVHGGERVAQWRDLAMAERGQLYGFDCQIMSALAYRHEDVTREAKYQAKQAEACRKAHGLAPADEVAGAAQPA